jgi:hypothetical protein
MGDRIRTGSRRRFDTPVLLGPGEVSTGWMSRLRHRPGSGWLCISISFAARGAYAATTVTVQACTAGMRSQLRRLFSSDSRASLAFEHAHVAATQHGRIPSVSR